MKTALTPISNISPSKVSYDGVKVGRIADISNEGCPYVKYTENDTDGLLARYSSSLSKHALFNALKTQVDVLLVFENGNPNKPIIIDTLAPKEEVDLRPNNLQQQEVTIDGNTITFNAKEQLTLKCGKASVTLTKAGKVMLKGAYLLNRSSGALRIKGGSVQIN